MSSRSWTLLLLALRRVWDGLKDRHSKLVCTQRFSLHWLIEIRTWITCTCNSHLACCKCLFNWEIEEFVLRESFGRSSRNWVLIRTSRCRIFDMFGCHGTAIKQLPFFRQVFLQDRCGVYGEKPAATIVFLLCPVSLNWSPGYMCVCVCDLERAVTSGYPKCCSLFFVAFSWQYLDWSPCKADVLGDWKSTVAFVRKKNLLLSPT